MIFFRFPVQLAVVAAHEAFRSGRLSTRSDVAADEWSDPRFSCHVGAGLIAVEVDESTMAMAASRCGNRLDLLRWGAGGLGRDKGFGSL